MREAGTRSTVFDLLFAFPTRDPAEDHALVEATRRAGDVIYALILEPVPEARATDEFRKKAAKHLIEADVRGDGAVPGAGRLTMPLPELVEASAGLGHIVRTTDRDGGLRRIPLVYAVKGGFVPALALAASFRHLDVDPTSLRIERGRALRFRLRSGREITIPIDAQGSTWINYAGEWGKRFRHYAYRELRARMNSAVERPKLLAELKGKTVVAVNLTTGSSDMAATPMENDFPLGEVHLHILSMFHTGQFLRGPTPLEAAASYVVPTLALTGAALLGGPGLILSAGALVLGVSVLILRAAFDSGVILPAVHPALSLTVALVLVLATRFWIVDRERLRFQSALGACLPPQTVREVGRSPGRIPQLLAARRRELSILFADVKGFSSFCARTDPLEIQRVLHEYLSAMTEIIRRYGGTLDKYMGDGILAFFGDAERGGPDDADEEARVQGQVANAVLAALAMQRSMRELNEQWRSQGREEHLIRIGINTGAVTVGNLGTQHLWDYTVVGHEVNKAQRLESAAPPGGLLIARRTYALAVKGGVLPGDIAPTSAALKGLGESTDLYAIPPDVIPGMSLPETHKARDPSTAL